METRSLILTFCFLVARMMRKTERDSAVIAILNQAESAMRLLVLAIDLGGRIHAIHV
jgi:hypothetical protein